MQNDSRFPNTAIQVIQAILVGLMQKKKKNTNFCQYLIKIRSVVGIM